MTQGERLVYYIRSFRTGLGRWPTYGDLQRTNISTSPHRRLDEPAHRKALRKNEVIARGATRDGRLVTFEIRRVRG